MRNLARNIWHTPRKVISAFILLYQRTLSPDHGPLRDLYPYGYCKHEPTCSVYAIKSIQTRGAVIGGICAIWRILRCNPWSKTDEKRLRMAVNKHIQP